MHCVRNLLLIIFTLLTVQSMAQCDSVYEFHGKIGRMYIVHPVLTAKADTSRAKTEQHKNFFKRRTPWKRIMLTDCRDTTSVDNLLHSFLEEYKVKQLKSRDIFVQIAYPKDITAGDLVRLANRFPHYFTIFINTVDHEVTLGL